MDYRFMPEPDLPPLVLTDAFVRGSPLPVGFSSHVRARTPCLQKPTFLAHLFRSTVCSCQSCRTKLLTLCCDATVRCCIAVPEPLAHTALLKPFPACPVRPQAARGRHSGGEWAGCRVSGRRCRRRRHAALPAPRRPAHPGRLGSYTVRPRWHAERLVERLRGARRRKTGRLVHRCTDVLSWLPSTQANMATRRTLFPPSSSARSLPWRTMARCLAWVPRRCGRGV